MLDPSYADAETLLFARGFLIWPDALDRPMIIDRLGWWPQAVVPGWNLAHAPELELAMSESRFGRLLLLGGGVAPEISSQSWDEIAVWLSEAVSVDELQRRIDAVSGRFAVFRFQDSSILVQNDVQGLRGVFHTDTTLPPVVGSHANLVGEVVSAPKNSFARKDFHKHTNLRTPPGRHTTRHGVLALLPNTELSMPSRQVTRIYPRAQRIEIPTSEILPQVEAELEAVLGLLARSEHPVLVSLSAGLDSRLTLALCRPHIQRLRFFTYDIEAVQNAANQHDTQDAMKLVQRFNLPHVLIRVQGGASAMIRKVLAVNRHRAHAPGLAEQYRELFSPDAVHLRSNGNGTLTSWYRRSGWPDVPVTAAYRMQLSAQKMRPDLGVLDAFTESWLASQAWKIEELGHSGLDFAYGEDRMGVWHQNIVQESDIAFETRVPFGSRKIVDLMLSTPLQDRRTGQLFVDLIRRRWPDLLDIPVNGVSLPRDGTDGMWALTDGPSRQVATRDDLFAASP